MARSNETAVLVGAKGNNLGKRQLMHEVSGDWAEDCTVYYLLLKGEGVHMPGWSTSQGRRI